jgi:hypothetical protein
MIRNGTSIESGSTVAIVLEPRQKLSNNNRLEDL